MCEFVNCEFEFQSNAHEHEIIVMRDEKRSHLKKKTEYFRLR